MSETPKQRRARARALGNCSVCCSQPARQGMLTCQACSDRAAAFNSQRRLADLAAGLCVRCHVRKRQTGKTQCRTCLALLRANSKTYR
jgi:predicted CXXCH cytochrome family protein